VAAYRVYGAAERSGPYQQLAQTKELQASFEVGAKPYTYFTVAALTRLEVEGEPSAPVEDLFRTAYRHFEQKQFEAALANFEHAARVGPSNAANIEYLGRSLLALGRHATAIGQFQTLGGRAGYEKQGMVLEAQALAASGDVLAARAVVERAIGARHADATTYTLCADLSLQLRDPAGAVRCADIALASDANNPHARAMRGEALVRLGTVDKGIAELDAANAAAPADAELWRRSGRVLLGLNRARKRCTASPRCSSCSRATPTRCSPRRRSTSGRASSTMRAPSRFRWSAARRRKAAAST
jgi:tetratricopeptide (TPR) repeat protein